MRGIVLTEFLDFAAQTYPDAGRLELDASRGSTPSPVATYPDEDLRDLVARTAEASGSPVPEVLRRFGAYLFPRFATIYPVFFQGSGDALRFLSRVHDHVHEDLRRFHPDAEVPELTCRWQGPRRLVLDYRSPRSLGDLAEGLIQGCIAYFGSPVRMERQDLPGPAGRAVRFTLAAIEQPLSGLRAAS